MRSSWRRIFPFGYRRLGAGMALLLALAFLAPTAGRAQLSNPKDLAASNPAGAYNTILMYLGQRRFDEGLELVNEVIRYWGPRAAEQFGPGFGHFHYLKGLLLMGTEDYAGAAESFRSCREDFPNELINEEGERESPRLQNRFLTHALAQWGACLMVLGDYPQAVEKLEGALAEASGVRIRTDIIGLNLGRSYLRSGDLEKGEVLLRKALQSEKLGADLKRRAFLILAEDWTHEVDFEEQVQPLLWEYGDLVRLDSRANRWSRNPVFAHLGLRALETGEPLRALAWYRFLLNPQELVAHREQELVALERAKPAGEDGDEVIEAWRKRVETARSGIAEAEAMVAAMLLGVGGGHYQLKNFAGAFVAFRHVVDAFPGHEKRPDALYNLVASGIQLGLWSEARHYGLLFLDEFPDHPLVGEVARLLVESTFILDEWEEAFSLASEVRERFKVGSVERDVPDFVVGASLYHLDRFEEADGEIEAYLKNYEEPRRLEAASYYRGSVKVKLFRWQEGADRLGEFLEQWPRSDLASSALYQSALCRFVLAEFETALALLETLQSEHPDAVEIPASWNLQGDVLTGQGEATRDTIEACYLEAKTLAAGNPVHFETGAYAHWKLILLEAGDSRHAEAVALYDDYRRLYAGSSHELEVVAAAIDSLVEEQRQAEAEKTVQDLIVTYANDAESGRLGQLMGTYLRFLDAYLTPDQVRARLRGFPGPEPTPVPLVSWLRIVLIERLEREEAKTGGVDLAPDIEEGYRELDRVTDFGQVPNYPLIKLARWHREAARGDRAREICEFLLEHRSGGPHVEMAMFDLAEILAESETDAEKERAVSLFRSVREEFEAPELVEESVLRGGRLLMDREDFAAAREWWTDYLRHRTWQRARPEANFQFGRCLEAGGSTPEALKIYASVYALYTGHLEWSTRAYLRAAQILKEDGRDGDALLVLIDMLKRLGHLEHPGIDEGRALFARWKQEWIENS